MEICALHTPEIPRQKKTASAVKSFDMILFIFMGVAAVTILLKVVMNSRCKIKHKFRNGMKKAALCEDEKQEVLMVRFIEKTMSDFI